MAEVRLDSVSTEVLLGELKKRMARLEVKRDLIQEDLNAKNKSVVDLRKASTITTSSSNHLDNVLPSKEKAEFIAEENDESSELVLDLFSNERCVGGPDEVIQRAKDVHGFDTVAFVKARMEKDDLAMARLVNFIRRSIAAGDSPSTVIKRVNENTNNWQEDDQFLTPFLGGNDPMLWWGDAFSEPDDGELDSDKDNEDDEEDEDDEDEVQEGKAKQATNDKEQEGELVEEDYYFDSYGRIDIHEEMLRDTVRTNSYLKSFQEAAKQAIFTTSEKGGTTIMDVGAGTGVLSMLAIREGGVKKVFCVEASRNTSRLCQTLLHTNGYETQCQVIGDKVESVVASRPDIKVDAIISEWMGYALLYESMLESVLVARDAFLKPNGRLFPNRARVLLEAVKDVDGRLKFWENVYGLNFAPARRARMSQADVIQLGEQSKVSNRVVLKDFDLETMKMDDMDLDEPFTLTTSDSRVDGICISFDCFFPTDEKSPSLSTTLEDEPTHWHQTVLWLDPAMEGLSIGTEIKGSLSFTRRVSTNRREYDLLLKITSPVEMIKIYGMS